MGENTLPGKFITVTVGLNVIIGLTLNMSIFKCAAIFVGIAWFLKDNTMIMEI